MPFYSLERWIEKELEEEWRKTPRDMDAYHGVRMSAALSKAYRQIALKLVGLLRDEKGNVPMHDEEFWNGKS